MVTESALGVGFALLAAVGLAGQSLSVRLSTQTHPVRDVVGILFGVNLIVLVPLAVVRHYPAFRLTPRAVLAFAISGLLGSLLARTALFIGIDRLGATRAEPLKSIFPVIAVGLAVFTLNETVSVPLLLGVLLLGGGAVGITREARASPVTSSGRRLVVDLSFPLGAVVLLGMDPVISKIGFATGTPAMVAVAIRMLAAAGGFGVYLLWHQVRTDTRWRPSPGRWVLAASVANTTYLLAYFGALAIAPVSVVAPILGASPLIVVLAAAAFFQTEEQVTARLGVAVAVLVAGVALILTA